MARAFRITKQEPRNYNILPSDQINSQSQMYLSADHALLSAEDELRLGKIIAESDDKAERQQAINCFVLHNLKLVIAVARKYRGNGVDLVDLVQEGNVGLIKAATKYDYTTGYKFSTYATYWIRQAVQRAVADQSRTIRIPVHKHDQINKIRRTLAEMAQDTGTIPTASELANRLEIDANAVEDALRYGQAILSLDEPLDEDSDASAFGDMVPDDTADDLGDLAMANIQRERIADALGTLEAREAKIITMRFGLDGSKPQTLEQVGNRFGLTRERIRQIEGDAMRKLRHPRRARILREVY